MPLKNGVTKLLHIKKCRKKVKKEKKKKKTKFQPFEAQEAGETEVRVEEDVVEELHSVAAVAAAAEEEGIMGLGLGF